MKLITTIILILTFSQAYAVDGYKNLKFGMSKDEVRKSGICTFKDGIPGKKMPFIKNINCSDFKFKGADTFASAYFIDGKFLRIAIDVDINDFSAIIDLIKKKYGPPSSSLTGSGIEKELNKPDNSIWIGFDKGTVNILLTTNNRLKITAYLIYNSPDYDNLVTSYKKKSIEDDI